MGQSARGGLGDNEVRSAGEGIAGSAFNPEEEDAAFFQIWIQPDQFGRNPCWGTRRLPAGECAGEFAVLVSGMEGDDALPIRANARVAAASLRRGRCARSEERRVGKEGVSTGRSWWSPYH